MTLHFTFSSSSSSYCHSCRWRMHVSFFSPFSDSLFLNILLSVSKNRGKVPSQSLTLCQKQNSLIQGKAFFASSLPWLLSDELSSAAPKYVGARNCLSLYFFFMFFAFFICCFVLIDSGKNKVTTRF